MEHGQTCCGVFRKPTSWVTKCLDPVNFGRAQRTLAQWLAPHTLRFDESGIKLGCRIFEPVISKALAAQQAGIAMSAAFSVRRGIIATGCHRVVHSE